MPHKEYSELLDNYQDMFKLFDMIHFNSSVTEDVYKHHLKVPNSEIIPITHAQINDNRVARKYDSKVLNLIFIGNTTAYKGFPLLEEVLLELYNEGQRDWQLNIWGATGESSNNQIKYNGYYKHNELSTLFNDNSLLIVPSVWSETFSLITLEALSYGVPALVSNSVGAKDLILKYDPWFIFNDKQTLKSKLSELLSSKSRLQQFNNSILSTEWSHTITEHSREISTLYTR